MRYIVGHRYSSTRDGQQFGPWEPDQELELTDADAEWVNRDSPGTLAPKPDKPKPAEKPAAVEREKTPGRDRQHRPGANRGT